MYLFIDEQYRVYQSKNFTRKNYELVRAGRLSMVDLSKMQGMDLDGKYSAIQEMPEDFEPDEAT